MKEKPEPLHVVFTSSEKAFRVEMRPATGEQTPDEWKPYEGATVESHWLDLEFGRGDQRPPRMRAGVKFDGCVHLESYSNGADPGKDDAQHVEDNRDYVHICDLEAHIKEMQALLAKAREHFGAEWPR